MENVLKRTPVLAGALAVVVVGGSLAATGCGSGDDSSTSSGATTAGGSAVATSASGSLPRGSEHTPIARGEFTTRIDNPYWPMAPGDHWVYREVEEGERQQVNVTVTNRTRNIEGVEARVVHDVVSRQGRVIEDTFDWYAQDSQGALWYFGEDTTEYKPGEPPSTAGSWEAGVDGAEPGIIMPASPRTGMAYREEYFKGEAEDNARITGTDAATSVPFGSYQGVVTTANTSPLEPNVVEHKWYARGVGPVREAIVAGGNGNTVLTDFTHGG